MSAALDRLEASGNQLTIIPYVPPPGWGPFNAYCQPDSQSGAQTPGTGTSSTIGWDPNVQGFGPVGTTPASSQPGADVILAHEMIHGLHNATGTQPAGPTNPAGLNVGEERSTVGLPAGTYNDPANPGDPLNGTALPNTAGTPPTENGVRGDYADRGIPSPATGVPPPQRPSYYPPNADRWARRSVLRPA